MKTVKKLLSFLLVLAIASGFALPSYAASLSFTLYPSLEKKTLQISGNTDAGRMLTFYVTDSGVSASEMSFDKSIYAMHQLTAENDGSFNVTLNLPEEMPQGTYKLIIGGVGKAFNEAERSREFDYVPSDGKAYTLEAENAAGTTNWDSVTSSSASGGAYLKIFEDRPSFTAENTKLTWDFSVEDTGEYDIFVILNQSGEHTSRHSFSVNGDKATSNESIVSKSIYTANFGKTHTAGMYWAKARSGVLIPEGAASITYEPTYSSLFPERILTGIDAVYVVPSSWNWEPYKLTAPYDARKLKVNFGSGSLSATTASRGGSITAYLSLNVPASVNYNVPVWAELRYKGERVAYEQTMAGSAMNTWTPGTAYRMSVSLNVPVVAPDGEYEVYCGVGVNSGFENVTGEKCIGTITIGNLSEPKPDTLTIETAQAVQNGKVLNVSYTLSESADVSTAKAFVRFWCGDVLWGVAESDAKTDVSTVCESISTTLTMPSGMPSGTYEAEIGFYNVNGTKTIGVMEIVSDKKNTYKPLSYGVYKAQKTGRHHFWYINQHGAAIWDGEPFVPIGGMYCPNILHGYYSFINPENNAATWAEDKREIDMLAENGITDIYLNSSINGTPNWVWEYVLDYLDQNGIRYGIQPNGGNGYTEQDAFYIFSSTSRISTEINATSAKTVEVSCNASLTTVGSADANYALYTAINSTGEAVSAGRAELTSSGNTYTFKANVSLPQRGKYTVYFTPNVNKSAGVVNFWKYGELMINKAQDFAKNVAMGDGARDIIDPATNESGYYNYNANARPYDAEYNALYKEWLSKKYKNVGELSDAWETDDVISSFSQASRIIPLYTSGVSSSSTPAAYKVIGYDEQEDQLFTFRGRETRMWLDFIEFRDYSTAEFYNDLADAYKTKLDLPTVIKSVYFHQESFRNQRTSGGLDGLGSESYAVGESVGQKHVVTYALANQFAKTAWNIVTETNTEENITAKYNAAYTTDESGNTVLKDSESLGYGTEQRMHTNFDQLIDSGAKGIYDLVLGARHSGTIHQAYSYVYMNDNYKTTNDQFGWLSNYKKNVDEDKIANSDPDKNVVYFMPGAAYTNGGGPNRYNAVHVQDHKTINYSYKASGNNRDYMVLLTDDPNIEAETIVASFEKGPISNKQGVEFGKMLENMPEDKQAVYLGFRYDLGTVPQLDKYFKNEFKTNSGGVQVQVLDPGETGEIIYATADGKPWAIRDGNLWIVAASDWLSGNRLKYIDDIGVFMDSDDTVMQDFGFKDANGATVDTLKTGEHTLGIRIKNNTNNETDAVMYAASYDNDGNLLSVSRKIRTLFSGLNYIETDLELSGSEGSAKGFVWDINMNPLTDELEIRK